MFKIIWTEEARIQFEDTLEYCIHHNKSNTYSNKLRIAVTKKQELILENPKYGKPLTYKGVLKVQVLKNFSLIYKLDNQNIIMIACWDNRRNPKDLKL